MTEPSSLLVPGVGIDIEVLLFEPGIPGPGILLLHGYGSHARSMAEPARELARNGYVAASMSMRGWGASGGIDDCGLLQPEDAVLVARWLAEHPLVAGRGVGLIGLSQGGQVALLAAARGAPVSAVVAWKAVTDIDRWREDTTWPGIPEYIDAVCSPERRERSPVDVAGSIHVPVLLIHGTADVRVPTDQSVRMADAITAAGGSVTLRLLAGVEHRMGPDGNAQAMAATLEFLADTLPI